MEYGPDTAREDFEFVFPNKRILYDGRLPLVEFATDENAKPVRADVVYTPHPEGHDMGAIWTRKVYDQKGGYRDLELVYPFFDPEGSLALVWDPGARKYFKTGLVLDSLTRTWARQRNMILPRVEKDLKPGQSFDVYAVRDDGVAPCR